MKNTILLYFIFIGVFISCNKNKDSDSDALNQLIGDWKLTEVYVDTGAGGDFTPVDSEKIITFYDDGTITSNGELCSMSIEADTLSFGTYSFTDATFNSSNCNPDFNYSFELVENILIITYPCIEPCEAKYEKL